MSAGNVSAPLPVASFDYALPVERIAQTPLYRRDASRLLLVGARGELSDRRFDELPSLLRAGDICVVNDTRVRAARLRGRTDSGGAAELLVVARETGPDYICLVRPARRMSAGTAVHLGHGLHALVGGPARGHAAARIVHFSAAGGDVEPAMERAGEAPLPPYIHERLDDRERYQTVYGSGPPVSAAAPTAGLHFTPEVIERLRRRGVGWAPVSLEVGLPTFAPIRSDDVGDHEMHGERFRVPAATASAIALARERGGRVVAIGTTAVRVLESSVDADGRVVQAEGETRLFVKPGHRFRAVDALLTNFHQPRSSLLVLLAAFIGDVRWGEAYEHALGSGYRFLSFGDCMLCWAPDAVGA